VRDKNALLRRGKDLRDARGIQRAPSSERGHLAGGSIKRRAGGKQRGGAGAAGEKENRWVVSEKPVGGVGAQKKPGGDAGCAWDLGEGA